MKTITLLVRIPRLVAALAVAAAFTQSARAVTNIWSGASGVDLFWSTAGNWSPAGPPGATDAVRFDNTGAALDAVTINNTVSASKIVQSVTYGQTNGYHNTLISPGVTLTISNTAATNLLVVGTETAISTTQQETNTISGAGGKLVILGTNAGSALVIREAFTSSGTQRATLDMSGLDTFVGTIGRVLLAVQGATIRPAGTWVLAKTNTITASGSAPAIAVGDGTSNGGIATMQLGATNALFADSITVARQKSNSRLEFNPVFTNSMTPTAYIRGRTTNRVGTLSVADNSAQTTSGTSTTGTIDFSGGILDALVNTAYIGRSQAGTGTGKSTGTLTLDQGTLDVNTLEVAYQQASGSAVVTGTVNVNGTAMLRVNNSLRMGRYLGGDLIPVASLNVGGGTVLVNGSFTNAGALSVNVTNGLLSLPVGSQLLAGTVTLDGGTISNATVLAATSSLIIANGGRITGTTNFDMGNSGASTWDFSALPAGFTVSNALQGSGTISGDLTQASGATINPGGTGVAGTMTFNNNLTLNGGKLPLDLSSSAYSGNDQIVTYGNLTLAGTNDVTLKSLSGSFDTTAPYSIINYSGLLVGNASYFRVFGPMAQSRYSFTFDTTTTAGAVQLLIGGAGSANLTWVGDNAANLWNFNGAANWNNGTGADKFFNLDAVTFDDSGSAAPAVNIVGTLFPGSIAMNNYTKSYTFAGTGGLASGALTQSGSGTLTFANSGDNSFAAAVTVNNGALTFSNASLNTFSAGVNVTAGQVAFTGACSNDFGTGGLLVNYGTTGIVANAGQNLFGSTLPVEGTLIFSQPVDGTLGAILSGSGTVIKAGVGTLTLSANNSALVNPVLVNGGILRVTAANTLPTTGAILTNGAGTLDVNGVNLGTKPVFVAGVGAGGLGAIVNNNGNQNYVNPNIAFLTLTGDTTFGGNGRWDLRSPGGSTGDPVTAGLSTGGMPYNLTKIGTSSVAIVSVTIDPALGDINIKEGSMSFEGTTTSMGNPAKTLTVDAGASLTFYRTTNLWNKKFVLNGSGTNTTVNCAFATNSVIGPVTMNGICVFGGVGNYLTNAGPVNGTGSLVKLGSFALVLAGASSYSGSTTVSNGFLIVDGTLAGSGVAVDGGILAGIGSISAPVTVNAGGTLSPAGDGIGTLTATGALTLGGTNRFDVAKTGGSFTHDLVQGSSGLTYGGMLQLILTGDALIAGDSFKLFGATTYAGAFTSIVPATPAPGLVWDTTALSSGTLRVAVPAAVINSVKLVGAELILSGTGGTPGGSYTMLSSTNLTLPMINWTTAGNGTFGPAGEFSYTNAANSATPELFLRLRQ